MNTKGVDSSATAFPGLDEANVAHGYAVSFSDINVSSVVSKDCGDGLIWNDGLKPHSITSVVAIPDVLAIIPKLKVIGVHTRFNVALVQNIHSFRDWSIMDFIGNSVSLQELLTANPDMSVPFAAVRSGPSPKPASIRVASVSNFLPESFLKWTSLVFNLPYALACKGTEFASVLFGSTNHEALTASRANLFNSCRLFHAELQNDDGLRTL